MRERALRTGTTVVTVTFKNIKTAKSTAKKYRCVVKAALEEKPAEESLALTDVKQVASNQIKVTFNKDASANTKDAYKIVATDGTKEIGVKAVTYAADGKSALIDTYANVDNGVTYTVSVGDLSKTFTASVGEVASISISTTNAQKDVKTPIKFTLFDANGIDVTPSISVDSTCVITLDGAYVTAEKDKASNASVTMGTVGSIVNVTITYNKGIAGSTSVTATQAITCVDASQTLGNAVFASTSTINTNSGCAKFYLGLSDKIVAVKENNSVTNVFFCAKDNSGNVISYDKYDVDSSNDDVATVTVTKDSGKYMQLTVNGNSVGSANLNISASKNGVATTYSIPVQVSKGTTAVKMVATATKPVMSNVEDDDYVGKIEAKLLDANGKEVPGYFTFSISKVVAEDKTQISLQNQSYNSSKNVGSVEVKAVNATPGTYAVKVIGSENADGSYAYEQNVQIQVKALPDAAYNPAGPGIKVTYQIELSNTELDENPSLTDLKNSTKAKLYAVYNGLFAGYVNEDGGVSDVPNASGGAVTGGDGIRVATSSAIKAPVVAVKFGNQYATPAAATVKLYDPATNFTTTTITTTAGLQAVDDGATDVTINAVDSASTIEYGDVTTKGALRWKNVARIGSYTVEYYYQDVETDKFVKTPISKSFTVKNTLTIPTVTVTSKKVSSFNEDKLIEVMKASVDMNNNSSDHESIIDLTNGYDTSLTDGNLSADGLKTTYKYAIVEDNFGTQTWKFFVPINTTFSYQ